MSAFSVWVNQSNLLNVTYQHESITPPTQIVKLAVLNIISPLKKSFLMKNLICTHKLVFLLLSETWLDHASSGTTLMESAPPNFTIMSVTRREEMRGYSHFSVQTVNFSSFQYLCALMKRSSYFVSNYIQ